MVVSDGLKYDTSSSEQILYKYFGRKRQYFQAESNPLRVHREIKEKPQSGMKY